MLKPEAIKLLRRIQRLIINEPLRIDMGVWRMLKDDAHEFDETKYPKCGTVACIGGWTEVLHYRQHPRSKAKAAVILGLNEDQARELFLEIDLMNAQPQTQAHAQAVVQHIDRFIEKYKEVR